MTTKLKIGNTFVNAYSQEVQITDIDDDSVVFEDVNNCSVDVLRVEEFKRIFKMLTKRDELIEPTKREFQKMIR